MATHKIGNKLTESRYNDNIETIDQPLRDVLVDLLPTFVISLITLMCTVFVPTSIIDFERSLYYSFILNSY